MTDALKLWKLWNSREDVVYLNVNDTWAIACESVPESQVDLLDGFGDLSPVSSPKRPG
jgi:hypothetical protein